MAATIDATVGGAAANSYVTELEFSAWAETRQPSTAFDSATADERVRSLISATRRIDQERFRGERTGADQALQFPRDGSDEIPARVKNAQMELAYQILSGAFTPDDSGLEGFLNVKVGPLDVTPNHGRRAGVLIESVRRDLAPYLVAGGNTVRLVRG